jgi:fluoroquinolone resistance protein
MDAFVEDQTFEKIDFTVKPLSKGDYDHCTFLHCNLSSINLSEIKFVDCVFRGCNLSMAAVSATVFRDVRFADCKMLGMRFDQASAFGFSCLFEGCTLDHSSFYQMKIKKADLRTAFNYSIDPERNRMKKAKLALAGVRGLLGKYDIVIE